MRHFMKSLTHISTYLQHDEVSEYFNKISQVKVEDPPLHRAVNNGDTELVEFLLDKAELNPLREENDPLNAVDCAAKR